MLGFTKRVDLPGDIRLLTPTSSEGADGVELVLEPNHFPPALASQKALGLDFRAEPKKLGPVTFAFFNDICSNFIVRSEGANI